MLADAPFIGSIPVRDLAVARKFYVQTLGLRVAAEDPFALIIDAGGTTVRLTVVDALAPQPFSIAGWTVPDLAAAVRALTAAGVEFNRYDGMHQDDLGVWTAPGGGQVAWFRDPDGNTLSLTAFAR